MALSSMTSPEDHTLRPGEGGGTVLVLERDPCIARMLLRVLHTAGVAAATVTLPEALRWSEAHRGRVCAAFVDECAGERDAAQLGRALRARWPGLPLVMAAAPAARTGCESLAAGGPVVFLAKPYLPSEAVERVRKLARMPQVRWPTAA